MKTGDLIHYVEDEKTFRALITKVHPNKVVDLVFVKESGESDARKNVIHSSSREHTEHIESYESKRKGAILIKRSRVKDCNFWAE